MKILITGASGFVGRELVPVLYNHAITTLGRNKPDDPLEVYNHIQKNIVDIEPEDVDGFDVIFHLASTIDNSNIFKDPKIDYETNCLGTIALLDACRISNPTVKIVYTSTFFAVGNSKSNPKPLSLYGASKLATEHIISVYNNVFNMNIITCRLSNIYGVGERLDNFKAQLNKMVHKAVNTQSIEIFNDGTDVRDFLYIDDCVSALLVLMDKGVKDVMYEVGYGVGCSMKNIANYITMITPTTVNNKESINPMNISSYVSDIHEMEKLGWYPKIAVSEGIRLMVDWYKGSYKGLL